MRVIIVGAGEVGYHVAERLASERHDVVVIDIRPERLEYVQSHIDVAVLEGSGSSPSVLERAGLGSAKMLLAVTSTDEVNLVSCMAARERKGVLKVARVSNPDFYAGKGRVRPELFGVDVMINPERELALETIRLLQSTVATDVAVFAGGAVQLVGLDVTPDAPIANRKLADISAELGPETRLLTAAIDRQGETIVPRGSTEVKVGDHVYVVATPDAIPQALSLCGHKRSSLRRVMIAGGSYEAYYLAGLLDQHGVQATLLVKDRSQAQDLAGRLPKALILHGDPTDVELLEMEGVGAVDAFLALTDDDEMNILSSLIAKNAGAKQVITLVNRVDYLPLGRRIGFDAVVSPRLSAANALLRYVRGGSVTRVAVLKDSGAEATSFFVSSAAPVIGKAVSELEFPKGSILAALVREHQVFIPRGDTVIEPGDTAIVVALPESLDSVSPMFPS